MIELMTVMIVLAILLVIAAPSFTGYFERKRLEGVFNELATDLQLARSEAVARNRAVRVTFGTGCYVVHVPVTGSTTTCTQTTETLSAGDAKIKTAQIASGSTTTLTPVSGLTRVDFDAVRGTATWNGSSTTAAEVDVGTSAGAWQLRAGAAAVGRVRTCSPSASFPGYAAC